MTSALNGTARKSYEHRAVPLCKVSIDKIVTCTRFALPMTTIKIHGSRCRKVCYLQLPKKERPPRMADISSGGEEQRLLILDCYLAQAQVTLEPHSPSYSTSDNYHRTLTQNPAGRDSSSHSFQFPTFSQDTIDRICFLSLCSIPLCFLLLPSLSPLACVSKV